MEQDHGKINQKKGEETQNDKLQTDIHTQEIVEWQHKKQMVSKKHNSHIHAPQFYIRKQKP